jgi:hypothetical protein
MPAMKPGNDIYVFNGGNQTLNVFPFNGAKIDALGINASFALSAGALGYWQVWGTTQIRTANIYP